MIASLTVRMVISYFPFTSPFLLISLISSQDYGKALAVLCELKLIKSADDELSACLTESDIFWLLLLLPFLRSYSFIYRSLLQVGISKMIFFKFNFS